MRVTRKIQSLVEAKIRHSIATGQLPRIDRSSTTATHPRHENKTDANGESQSK